ncbi:MAG: menaquinone biosynthesis protein [Paenibacillaceae bacterium]|nr:menaquinone biosynthesis protein [Paenibacillaceae bacterium]
MHSATRFGRITYANAWPLLHDVRPRTPVRWIDGSPAHINAMMRNNDVDIAIMSSHAFLEQAEHVLLVRDVSIGAVGAVHSILLFLRVDEPRTIALTESSATSTHMLRMMLAQSGHRIAYVPMRPELEHMLEQCDAALLIGDDAIRAKWAYPHIKTMDVGAMWQAHTGLPMTYAVVAVRAQYATQRPDAIAALIRALTERVARPRNDVIAHAVAAIGGDVAYWTHYFAQLQYGPPDARALHAYAVRATECGFLSRVPQVHWL